MFIRYIDASWGFASSARSAPPILRDEGLMKPAEFQVTLVSPFDPAIEHFGRLRFVPGDGIHVHAAGSLLPNRLQDRGFTFDRLIGRTELGVPFVLRDARALIERNLIDPAASRTKIDARSAIIGVPRENAAALRFSGARFRFSHLDQWCGPQYEIEGLGDAHTRAVVVARASDLEFSVEYEGVRIGIKVAPELSYGNDGPPRGPAFSSKQFIATSFSSELAFDQVLAVGKVLRSLLSLLVGAGVYLVELDVLVEGGDGESGRQMPVLIGVEIPAVVQLDSFYFVSVLRDVEDRLPRIARAWFANWDKFRLVANERLEIASSDGLSREMVFLRTVEVLSHLHDLIWSKPRPYLAKEQWKVAKDELVKALASLKAESLNISGREWEEARVLYMGRLDDLNRATFRERLETLFRATDPKSLSPAMGNPRSLDDSIDELVPRLVDTRNHFTHPKLKPIGNVLTGRELEDAIMTCWGVLGYWLALGAVADRDLADRLSVMSVRSLFLVRGS